VQSSTLTISNVTDKSFGIYKCSVKANIGNYSESINLQASSTNQGIGLQFLSFFKKVKVINIFCSSKSYGSHCFGFGHGLGSSFNCHYHFSRQIS
jgi:hypothetical protein